MRRALCALALLTLAGCSSDGGSEDDGGDKSIEAEVYCEEFVDRELRAPATAEYNPTSSREAQPDVWVVTGTVDAENAFGAQIRENYRCRMREIEGGWRLLNNRALQ